MFAHDVSSGFCGILASQGLVGVALWSFGRIFEVGHDET